MPVLPPTIRRPHRALPTAALAILSVVGCAPRPLVLPADRPGDFTMLVTVYPAAADPPAWLRPARYAVEPDGLLRAESGPGVAQPGFPPIARRLERAELDYVYALAATADPFGPHAQPVPGPTVFEPLSDQPTALIEAGSGGRFRAAAHPAAPDGPLAPLIRELARLSWLDAD